MKNNYLSLVFAFVVINVNILSVNPVVDACVQGYI